MSHYRYISFFLSTFVIFHDSASRAIPPLTMIGGMVKKNCSDPLDTGNFCWSGQLQATFLGVFYYGYCLQMLPTYLAARAGFNTCVRLAIFICAVIQLTSPVMIAAFPIIAVVVQGCRGFVSGLFITMNYECARKWGLGNEGKFVISLSGMMNYIGTGVGPFIAGLLTKSAGWMYAYYLSGAIFLVAFLLQCVFVPDNPVDARFMSSTERGMFAEKRQREERVPENKSTLSLVSLFQRRFLYCFCLYQICRNFLYYSVLTMMPFYLNEMFGKDTEFLAYISLALCLSLALSAIGWGSLLPCVDQRTAWFKTRVLILTVPMLARGACFAVIPFVRNLEGCIALLVLHNVLEGTVYSGGIMTVSFELDPAHSKVVVGVHNGVGQTAGFIAPLVSTAFTSVGETRADYWEVKGRRWRDFLLLNGGVAAVAVASVLLAVLWRRQEWRKHPSLCLESEKTGAETGDKECTVIQNIAADSM